MKIVSTLKNTKADKAAKQTNLINAHNRTIRYGGNTYKIIVASLCGLTLADVENMQGNAPLINIFGDDTAAKDIRKLIENKLYS